MQILTFNTWANHGPAERIRLLIEQLNALSPQILCLQEVAEATMLNALPYYSSSFYAPASGLAILSTFPMRQQRQVTYQTVSPLEEAPRQAILVELEINGQSLWVVNTHLAWKAEDETSRLGQVEELLEISASLGPQVFLSGDFNAQPKHPPIEQIRQRGFMDLFSTLHPIHPGITWDNRNPFIQSHSVRFPDRRIDYLFLHQKASSSFVPTDCEVVLREPSKDGIYPSDHYGVLATLRIENR